MISLWQKLERLLRLEPEILSVEKRLRLLERKLLRTFEPNQRRIFLEYEALANERQELAVARALEVSARRTIAKQRADDR